MNGNRWVYLAGWILAGGMLVGCKASGGRIMSESEEDYVDTGGAGAATYDRLINGAVGKLLTKYQPRADAAARPLSVAYVGVENASGEELGEWREQIQELIDTSINGFSGFRTISRRFLDAGLTETRLGVDDLFLPKHQRTLISALEAQGNPVDFLLFSKLTRGSTQGEGVTQRNYALSMELVDIETGENDRATEQLRKAFSD